MAETAAISDLDKIAMMDFLDDNYGIDTIETGATIAVAMEAGLAEFGDADAAIRMIQDIGKGTHLGRILGGGAAATGKAYGVTRGYRWSKGQAQCLLTIPRAVQGIGVTYATSPMGADHTAGYAVAQRPESGRRRDALKPEGQVETFEEPPDCNRCDRTYRHVLFIAFAVLDQAGNVSGIS